MSSEYAIEVNGLGKCYQIYDKPIDRLKQMLFRGRRPYSKEFWALKNISFKVKKGETVGIIGKNGSGKSTLLQMICGILNPTTGEINVNGKVAALLELGAGFNPEFTGKENVFLVAGLLGLSNIEIQKCYDSILEFADIGEFINQPVKTYSSGMYVRLAFAINIMTNPEIMIIDEALAVGDMAFQSKCITALRSLQSKGTTIFFVSHDIETVRSLCNSVIYLNKGSLKHIGRASDVVEEYIKHVRHDMNQQHNLNFPDGEKTNRKQGSNRQLLSFSEIEYFKYKNNQFRYGANGAHIDFVTLLDNDLNRLSSVHFDQIVIIKIYFTSQVNAKISVNYYIQDDKKNLILGSTPLDCDRPLIDCTPGDSYEVTYTTKLPLIDGNYSIQVQLTSPIILNESVIFLDVIPDAFVFKMEKKYPHKIWTKVALMNSMDVMKCN